MNLDDMGGESNVGGANQIFFFFIFLFLPYFSDIDFFFVLFHLMAFTFDGIIDI